MKIIEDENKNQKLVSEDTLNKSIIAIRVGLQKANLKKSGRNSFSNFDYYELSDFLPKLNELMLQEEVNDIFTIEDEEYREYAKLILVKQNKITNEVEQNVYKIPFTLFDTPLNWKFNKVTGETEQVKSMQDIQYLGALNTYYKRYLYLNAFGITDGEIIDSMDNTNITAKKETKVKAKEKVQEDLDNMVDYEYQQTLKTSGQNEKELLTHYGVKTPDELTLKQKQEAIAVMKVKIKKAKNILEEASEQLKEEGLE